MIHHARCSNIQRRLQLGNVEHLAFIGSLRGDQLADAVLPVPPQRGVGDHAMLVFYGGSSLGLRWARRVVARR